MVKTNSETLVLARQIAAAASKIKAVDVKILDLRKLTSLADYFVICGATSDRHAEAIGDSIVREVKNAGRMPLGIEGYEHAQWIIADYGDVVAHIFYGPLREIYAIEKLWADAPRVRMRKESAKTREKKKKFKH
jgi:ribosome-associated protein